MEGDSLYCDHLELPPSVYILSTNKLRQERKVAATKNVLTRIIECVGEAIAASLFDS